ncbi:MAG: hypothetical protein A4E66_00785 [Syntrophus sp. PtaB.Bin001]|jgi:hypothetical protein|nr:MAG: hypothetical protein A4E66_00785 [Syntrophus sp. PtaB.Bin001]
MKFFLCVLGMVFIIEGLPYAAFPRKMKAFLAKLPAIPDSTLQIMGLLAMLTGLLLTYLGRS